MLQDVAVIQMQVSMPKRCHGIKSQYNVIIIKLEGHHLQQEANRSENCFTLITEII